MTQKHTPGPWVARWPVNDEHPWIEAECNFKTNEDGKEYYMSVSGLCSKADAHLIAAAPDLLAALAEALDAWDTHNKYGDGMQGHWAQDARAAITKARGEAQ